MFKTLSVAEDNYESDRITFEYVNLYGDDFRIVVLSDKKIVFHNKQAIIKLKHFTRTDLKSLIIALQEADTFLSEIELVNRLMGK